MSDDRFDYDLIILGGGYAGVSAARLATDRYPGKRVCIINEAKVVPSIRGPRQTASGMMIQTRWRQLGGTCLNAGCLSKKFLIHTTELIDSLNWDMEAFGLRILPGSSTDSGTGSSAPAKRPKPVYYPGSIYLHWSETFEEIWKALDKMADEEVAHLRSAGVELITGSGSFQTPTDSHAIQINDTFSASKRIIRGRNIILASGTEPNVCLREKCPGVSSASLTSEQFLCLQRRRPSTVLMVGGGFVGMEFASFLAGMFIPTTVATLLPVLDQLDRDCVLRLIHVLRSEIPLYVYENTCLRSAVQLPEATESPSTIVGSGFAPIIDPATVSEVSFLRKLPGDDLVKEYSVDGRNMIVNADFNLGGFDTIILAAGRVCSPVSDRLNLTAVGVTLDDKGFVRTRNLRSNVDHIWTVGDLSSELTSQSLASMATRTGEMVVGRIFGNTVSGHQPPTDENMDLDPDKVPMVVSCVPIQYATCGLTETRAVERHGRANVRVYHKEFLPTEWVLSSASSSTDLTSGTVRSPSEPHLCYVKLITRTTDGLVLGMHYLGPTGYEIASVMGLLINARVTKEDLDQSVGLYPTNFDHFLRLDTERADLSVPTVSDSFTSLAANRRRQRMAARTQRLNSYK